MKRIAVIAAAAAMALALAACGSGNSSPTPAESSSAPVSSAAIETSSALADTSAEEAGMPNPWSPAATAEEAGESAGVGYFIVPEEGTESSIGPINWFSFEYMTELAQADGGIGAASITVRKGLNQNSHDVSGDYNEYAYEWTIEADGWDVSCFGNEEGRIMKAIWISDNFAYSIEIRGQGDQYDTFGLGEEDVALLVSAIQ